MLGRTAHDFADTHLDPLSSFYFSQCHNLLNVYYLAPADFTCLTTELFTYELDTLALVRLRLTQRAELRSDLAYELLTVDALQRYDRVAFFSVTAVAVTSGGSIRCVSCE